MTALDLGPVYQNTNLLTLAEAIGHLYKLDACLVIVSVNSREDLAQLVKVHRVMANPKLGKCFKFLVVTRMGATFDKSLLKLGLKDFIELTSSPKSLRSQLDFWLKSLRAQVLARVSENPSGGRSPEPSTGEVKELKPGGVIWENGIYFPEDIWRVEDTGDVIKVQNCWCIRLKGPSPDVAKWIETAVKGSWKLSFISAEDSRHSFKGAWFFWGSQRPEFVLKDNVWLFSSEEMTLAYVIGGEVQFSRLRTMGASIHVQHNTHVNASKADDSFVSAESSGATTVPTAESLGIGTNLQPTSQDQSAKAPWYLDGRGYRQKTRAEQDGVDGKRDSAPSSGPLTILPLSKPDSLPEVVGSAEARIEDNQDGPLKMTTKTDLDDIYQRRLKSLIEKGARQFRR
jgi:hypothetical protein